MKNLLRVFEAKRSRTNSVDIDNSFKAGDEIVVCIAYKENGKERIQKIRGNVIQRHHPNTSGETFTIMKKTEGVGVEITFYINSSLIKSIIVLNRAKVRRARLFYLRRSRGAKIKYKILRKNNNNDGGVKEPLYKKAVLDVEKDGKVIEEEKEEQLPVDEQKVDVFRKVDKNREAIEDSDSDFIDEVDVNTEKQ